MPSNPTQFPNGNTAAQKGDNPRTAAIHIRCEPSEKSALVKAANGEKISVYIRGKLGMKTP